MAADLKANLKKVISSAGKKKFFFAYGLGKRKDKKGEGELIVRTKRPKKVEVEGQLADTGDIFEGVCWSGGGPDDTGTVYFKSKGKKLSMQTIAKMKLTAKVTLGQVHDFQMPSPQEEARADALSEEETEETEGDEMADTTTGPVPPPPPGVSAPPGPGAYLPPPPPPGLTAPPPGNVPTTTPPPSPSQAGTDVTRRLNAMSAGIKTALAGPQKARVQTLVVAVNGLIKNKNFDQADRILDELETLLASSTDAPPQPPPSSGGADVVRRLNAISGNIKAALAGSEKARVQSLVVSVNGAIKNKDFATAETVLTELEALVLQAPPPPIDPEEAMRAEWVRRMIAIEPRVLQAQKTRSSEANWATLFRSIQDIGNARKFEKALQAVDDLEARLNAPPPPPSPSPTVEMESETSESEIDESAEDADTPSEDTPYSPFESESESESEEPEYAGDTADEIPEAPPYPDNAEDESAETQTEEPSTDDPYEAPYRELLGKLETSLQRLNADDPNAAAPIQQSVDYAKTYAQGGDFANAYAWLEQASQALANVPNEPTEETDESQSEETGNEDASAYSNRLRKLETDLQQLRTNNPDIAASIQQSIDYAQAFAQGGDFVNASAWLDQAAQDLANAPGLRDEEQPTGVKGPKVLYAQARLDWESVRKTVQVDIQKLEKAILEDYAGDPQESEVRQKIRKLDEILKGFDDQLQDKLDEALNMTDDQKVSLHQEALAIIDRYQTYVDGDPFVKDIDANPFIPMSIAKTVTSVLNSLADRLKT